MKQLLFSVFVFTLLANSLTLYAQCENATAAVPGVNIYSSNGSSAWYTYTMPSTPNQKIVISSPTSINAYIYTGGCSGPIYYGALYPYENSDGAIGGLPANEQILIQIYGFVNSSFDWTLSLADELAGESCVTAISAGSENIAPIVATNEAWFVYTAPAQTKKIIISSANQNQLQIYRGSCGENLIPAMSGYGNLAISDLNPGEVFYIAWGNPNNEFPWQLTVEDLGPGDLCLSAITASEGQNSLSSVGGYAWFTYTVPEGQDKKLVLTSDISGYVEVYAGSCYNPLYVTNGFEDIAAISPPVGPVFIRWQPFYPGEYSWNLALADILPGESCPNAIQITTEVDNIVPATEVYDFWYRFTMPEGVGKKLVIESSSNRYFYLFSGTCDDNFYEGYGYGSGESLNFEPGEQGFIRWSTYGGGNFDFTVAFESIDDAGEEPVNTECLTAVDASSGINNTPQAPYWFKYTMPATGDLVISSVGLATNDTYLRLVNECGETPFATSDDFSGYQSQITTPLSQGETVYILWDNTYSSAGFNWSLQVTNVAQSIVFNPPPEKALGDANFNLTAYATSGLPVSYESSNTAVATISGATVTIVGTGSTTITASQPGNEVYEAALDQQQTLTVKASQSINFGELQSKLVNDAPFELSATATSGLGVTFTSSNPSVATVSGTTVTIHASGTTTITASQIGNETYIAAAAVPRDLVVNKLTQIVSFDELIPRSVSEAPFSLSATATSELPVTFTSSNLSVATIAGTTVTIVGGGTTTITARQAGNTLYEAAETQRDLIVNKQMQQLSFEPLAPKVATDADFQLSAAATSGLTITFVSSNTSVATVSGTTVTIVGAGTTTITASQIGNEVYLPAEQVARTLIVNKSTQSINFGSLSAQGFGNNPLSLIATATSGLAVSFSTTTPATIRIDGTSITFLSAGAATVIASQGGNEKYLQAMPVEHTFCVNPLRPSIAANFNDAGAPVLTSSSPLQNQWYKNGQPIEGATGQNYNVSGAGDFQVNTTVGTCSSQLSDIFSILITDVAAQEIAMSVFPNPAADQVSVGGVSEHSVMRLVSSSGKEQRIVSTWDHDKKQHLLSLSTFASGMYTLTILEGKRIRVVKFIKY